MKLVLRVLKTVLRNQKKLIFKNRLKHLKRKCFSVLRQKQPCSHGVKNGCKNLQRFSFKPLKCLSSEQGFTNKWQMFLNKLKRFWLFSELVSYMPLAFFVLFFVTKQLLHVERFLLRKNYTWYDFSGSLGIDCFKLPWATFAK